MGVADKYRDGVVLRSILVGSIEDDIDGEFYLPGEDGLDAYAKFRYGRTGTHEVGHYFGLSHIWGMKNSCSTNDPDADDGIEDTPFQQYIIAGCPADGSSNSCPDAIDSETGSNLPDMTINFMGYVDDECMYVFTEEQAWTMRLTLQASRTQMYNNAVDADQQINPEDVDVELKDDFVCEDGCEIVQEFIDDGYCDCSQCEDEQFWDCDTCNTLYDTCIDTCGGFTECIADISTTDVSTTLDNTDGDRCLSALTACVIMIFIFVFSNW